jgi:hypothetical protein
MDDYMDSLSEIRKQRFIDENEVSQYALPVVNYYTKEEIEEEFKRYVVELKKIWDAIQEIMEAISVVAGDVVELQQARVITTNRPDPKLQVN